MYMYAIFRSMGLIEEVMDAATCICMLSSEAWVSFRSMGLIEVVMDAATCICVLSSEAWVSLK